MQPQIPINVDPESGVWSTGALPMLYVPRHFFLNNHDAIEKALGRAAYASVLFESGYTSAYQWCASEAAEHGMQGMAVFEHYLRQISKRGWGQFSLTATSNGWSPLTVELRQSAFVLGQPDKTGRLCYMFQGWFAGAVDWIREDRGESNASGPPECIEVQCCSEGHKRCLFEVGHA